MTKQQTSAVDCGWTVFSPRDEIRPEFSCDLKGGPDGKSSLVIRSPRREGVVG